MSQEGGTMATCSGNLRRRSRSHLLQFGHQLMSVPGPRDSMVGGRVKKNICLRMMAIM